MSQILKFNNRKIKNAFVDQLNLKLFSNTFA